MNKFAAGVVNLNCNLHKNLSESHTKQTTEYFKKISSHTSGVKRILEVGCNTEHNLIILSKLGHFELVGIEP